MKSRFQLIPAVFMVFRDEDKVLMLRRVNTGWRDGEYTLPSGHLDGDETARAAAVRELKEEVGAEVKPNDLHFVHVMHRRGDEGDHERVDFFFEVTKYEGQLQNAEPEKADDFKWFPINSLSEKTVPVVKQALEKISNHEFYSELNF
jgi:8-oxo-dGTP diphosphatase